MSCGLGLMESQPSRRRITPLIISTILVASMVSPARAGLTQSQPAMSIELLLFSDGWADVTIRLNLTGEEIFTVLPVLGEPSLLIVTDEKGLPLNFTLEEGSLVVETLGARGIEVSYQTPSLTSKAGEVWNASVSVGIPVEVTFVLPERSAVVGLSSPPSRVETRDSRIAVTFVGKHAWVSYVIELPRVAPTETTSPTQTPSEPSTQGASRSGVEYLLPLAAAALAAVAFVVIKVVRAPKRAVRPLEQVDEVILKKLEEMGGSAYQADLIRALQIPRTTAWRRIRRLAQAGLLEIKEAERGRLVVLKRTERT